MNRKPRGFTLIELLVVVAIIALLIAILLPSLARAKERAKTVLCASNMRSTGQIVMLFAAEHDNRCPGGGHGRLSSTDTTGTSFSWVDILNAEGIENTSGKYNVDMRGGVSYQTLSCPNFIQAPGGSVREMVFNENANGLTNTINGVTFTTGVSFTLTQMQAISEFYQSDDVLPLDTYYLGARMERFRTDEYMMLESYAGNDEVGTIVGNAKGQANPLGNSQFGGPGGYFVYTSPPGYAPQYRHPWGQGANFLCFDCHVQFSKAGDDDVLDLPNVGTTGYSHMNILP